MPQRNDARVAKDEIERQREQRGDGNLARERQVVREQQERNERGSPEHELDRPPSGLALEKRMRIGNRT